MTVKNEIPPNEALFSLGTATDLSGLTPRQIRYYEKHGLIKPKRNKGNQRIFSLLDIYRLIDIKQRIERGVNIAGIKEIYQSQGEEIGSKWAEEEQPLPSDLYDLLKSSLQRRE